MLFGSKGASRTVHRPPFAGVLLMFGLFAVQAARAGLPSIPASPVPVQKQEFDANGNLTKTIVAPDTGLTAQTKHRYNALGQRKDTTDARQGVTQFGYDAMGRVVKVTDPRLLETLSPTSGFGDVRQLTSPDTGLATYTYTATGNIKTKTDSRGVTATYTWDALDRLTKVSYAQTGETTRVFNWAYDETGSGFSNGIGRLTSTSYPTGSSQYAYDTQGRLISFTQVVKSATGGNAANVTRAVGYQYDGAGHVTGIVYPSGRKVHIGYTLGKSNTLGIAESATAAPVPVLSNMMWFPFGPLEQWSVEIVGDRRYSFAATFDAQGRPVRHHMGTLVRDITYDDAGRITSYKHYDFNNSAPQPAFDQSFDYNKMGQLTGVTTATASWAYSYDLNGNRKWLTLSGQRSDYAIAADSNRLNSITNPARGLTYDPAGNTLGDTNPAAPYTATYGVDNRLKTLTVGTRISTYAYNGDGQRVRKFDSTGSASTVIFVYDQSGQLLGEYDQTGTPIREYVWLEDRPVAMFTPDPAGVALPPVILHIHTDHLNTPRMLTDRSFPMRVRWRWMGEPFGTSQPETNPSGLGAMVFPLRFPGQYADAESGLNYNYFRTYDVSTSRYTQSDPIGLAGGINTYAYAESQPTSLIDPLGLSTYLCTQPLHSLGKVGEWVYAPKWNKLHHKFIGVIRPDGSTHVGGQDRAGGPWSDGTPSKGDAEQGNHQCEQVEDDNECLEQCLLRKMSSSQRPKYALIPGTVNDGENCQSWAEKTIQECRQQCKVRQ